jgi:5-oxoprolinase (ATP-hydrolysing) subunit C
MISIVVENPGLQTTIQDFGRAGYGPLGISASGAADPVALHIGNLLVGNPAGSAALEMTLVGGHFLFSQDATIVLAGSDFCASASDRPLPPWQSHRIRAGERVVVRATRDGARCYLCIAGKLDVPPFLGSVSTHLLSGLGGLQGRALRKGDVLHVLGPFPAFAPRTVSAHILESLRLRQLLRVTDGPQSDLFSEETQQSFYAASFQVSEESNRLGLRLEGPRIKSASKSEMITEGATLGAVQVPQSGQPIILFVEQQTTGGYPKIANVISADLFRIGQLRPRDCVQFERISLPAAHAAWIDLQELLASGDKLFA